MTTPLGTLEVVEREGRRVRVARRTRETDIRVALDLDGTGQAAIDTGKSMAVWPDPSRSRATPMSVSRVRRATPTRRPSRSRTSRVPRGVVMRKAPAGWRGAWKRPPRRRRPDDHPRRDRGRSAEREIASRSPWPNVRGTRPCASARGLGPGPLAVTRSSRMKLVTDGWGRHPAAARPAARRGAPAPRGPRWRASRTGRGAQRPPQFSRDGAPRMDPGGRYRATRRRVAGAATAKPTRRPAIA